MEEKQCILVVIGATEDGKKAVVTMAFKLCQCAQKRWQRLYGYSKLGKVIRATKFINGIDKFGTLPNLLIHNI